MQIFIRDAVRIYRKMRQKPVFLFGLFCVLVIFCFSRSTNRYPEVLGLQETIIPARVKDEIKVAKPAPIPEKTGVDMPEISAEGVAVFDLDSHTFLFDKNGDAVFSPASLTKVATAYASLKHCSLPEVIEVKQLETEGSQMGLQKEEKISVENLLYGMFLNSGNDAARALFDGCLEGNNETFRSALDILRLQHTSLLGPTGLEEENHFSSPKDLAILAAALYQNTDIQTIVSQTEKTVTSVDQTQWHALKNSNPLLGILPGVVGMKTGWTEKAGECMITVYKQGSHTMMIVVLKSRDREKDTRELIDWASSSYQW